MPDKSKYDIIPFAEFYFYVVFPVLFPLPTAASVGGGGL